MDPTTSFLTQNMTEANMYVPIGFLLLSALILWIVLFSKGWWWAKLGVITFVCFFSISMWHSLDDIMGWAVDKELPEKFVVHWVIVKEPNKTITGHKGGIFLVVKDITPDSEKVEPEGLDKYLVSLNPPTRNEPRTHKVPYSRRLHKQCQAAQQKIREGKTIYGTKKGVMGKGGEKGEGKGKGKGKGKGREGDGEGEKGGGSSFSQKQDSVFHELPPALMPSKNE